MEDVTLSGCL